MSNLAIRAALETRLAALFPDFPTAFENAEFDEPEKDPFQEAYVLFSDPDNPTMGDEFYRQRGIFQITCRFPLLEGSENAGLHGEILRQGFARGLSLSADGVTTHIERTPAIGNGSNIAGRWVIIVRVTFYADVMGA